MNSRVFDRSLIINQFTWKVLLVLGFGAGTAAAGTFAIADPTLTIGDELFGPGPAPSGVGVGADVNALSYGHTGIFSLGLVTSFEFSVGPGSTSAFGGSPIGLEIGSGEGASADIYGSTFPPVGAHFGVWDGDGVGPGPNGPSGSPGLGLFDSPGGDDIDGWDSRLPGTVSDIYFSLEPGTAGLTGVGAGDVLFSPITPGYSTIGPGGIYATAAAMGLFPGDDLDALVIMENDGLPGVFTPGVDIVLFSLAPGSPTLGIFGLSAADVLVDAGAAGPLGVPTVGGAGTPGFVAPAAAFDLAFTDNMNAMDVRVIPEPGSLSLLGVSLLGLMFRRR